MFEKAVLSSDVSVDSGTCTSMQMSGGLYYMWNVTEGGGVYGCFKVLSPFCFS